MNEPKKRRFGDRSTGAPTLINEGCHISGVISGKGDYQVSGEVEGDIVAAGKVEITDSARITGTVTGEAIAVAEGAVVEGIMKTTGHSDPVEFVEKRGGSD